MAGLILDRQSDVLVEEELTYGNVPTVPLTNHAYIKPIAGSVNPTLSFIKMENANGRRYPTRRQTQTKTFEWNLQLQVHPILIGWFFKWAIGNQIAVSSTQFQYTLLDVGVRLKSFSLYIDCNEPNFWATGEQTLLMLGCKISRFRYETDGMGEDQRHLLTLEGLAQKPNVDVGDVLTGKLPLRFSERLLTGSALPTPYLFRKAQPRANGADVDTFKQFAIEVNNTLEPRRYAKAVDDLYIDDIFVTTQRVTFEATEDYINAATRMNQFLNDTNIALQFNSTHPTSTPTYQINFDLFRTRIDEIGALASFAGGEAPTDQTYTGEGLEDTRVEVVNDSALTGTDHSLDIDTAFVIGTSGDAEAKEFSPTADGYLTHATMKLKTSVVGGEDIVVAILTDDGGAPSEPTPGAAGLVSGSRSNRVDGQVVTTSYQTFNVVFPSHPKLLAANTYWYAIYTTAGGTLNIDIDGDVSGTNTHSVTTDGGTTWSVPDSDEWGIDLFFDDIPMAVDLRVDSAVTFPDAV